MQHFHIQQDMYKFTISVGRCNIFTFNKTCINLLYLLDDATFSHSTRHVSIYYICWTMQHFHIQQDMYQFTISVGRCNIFTFNKTCINLLYLLDDATFSHSTRHVSIYYICWTMQHFHIQQDMYKFTISVGRCNIFTFNKTCINLLYLLEMSPPEYTGLIRKLSEFIFE